MVTREQYIRNNLIIRNRMIKEFAPKIYAALEAQIAVAVDHVKTRGIASATGQLHGGAINTGLYSVIQELYKAAAKQAIAKYKPNIKAGGFGTNQPFIDSVIEYFKKFLLNKVVLPITQTTNDFIEKVLQDALKNGWGVDKTVKQLENSDITKNRARMIVRTETVRATNYTQLAAADNEVFVMNKEWIAVEDNRTRRAHSHAGVDGEIQPLDGSFTNGLKFPGDPDAPADEVINCRCVLGYKAARDENNKLIRKTNSDIDFASRLKLAE